MSLLPSPVYADTNPVEFYEDLADTVGVAIDLSSDVWLNKTKLAYLAYINQNMLNSNAQSFYETGASIEQLTGYNVVSVRDGRYYMNSCDDGSGGAMYDIDCGDPSNMAALSKETMKWIRYATNNGPDWPNGSSGGGSGDGQLPEGYYGGYVLDRMIVTDITVIDENNESQTVSTADYDTCILVFADESVYQSVESLLSSNAGVMVQTSKSSRFMVPLDGGYFDLVEGRYRYYFGTQKRWLTVNTNYVTSSWRLIDGTLYYVVPGTSLKSSERTFSSGNYYNVVTNEYMAISPNGGFGGGGGGGAIEGDDTVPNPPTVPQPEISWPDISFPSLPDFNPTLNITTEGTYEPTTGEIDFTPITDRLDAINENLEFFYDSFNSFRSDFLSYMDSLGDNLNDISVRLWELEKKAREVITWLRNIFYNMGNGGSSQPDPSTNDEGWWDWLGKLIDALVGDLPSGIGSFTSALSQLTGRFPFSVPWDMAFMLGLLSHEPVTPVVTLYLPTFNASGYVGLSTPLVVDLTGWSLVAEVVRRSEFLLFALALATWTIEGIKGIDWTLFD